MRMMVLAAIVAFAGLIAVFFYGNHGFLALAGAFGGCVWLLYALIREAASRKSPAR